MELLVITALILLFTLNMVAIFLLDNTLKELLKQTNQVNVENIEHSNKEPKSRIRARIAPTDFSNVLNGRAYDKYKNKDGLYEPVKQKGGIPLQTNKKEE